jgi:hypothetical protein
MSLSSLMCTHRPINDGTFKLVPLNFSVTGVSVSELTLRLSNLDIANSLARMIDGDKKTPIRCMVNKLEAVKDDFQIQTMLLDTPKMNIYGSGNVNLKTEELNIVFKAHSKSFSLAVLRGPIIIIIISGTLKNPAINPELDKVFIRASFAAVLSSVTSGLAALIPLLWFGENQQSHCNELITEAKDENKTNKSPSNKPTYTNNRDTQHQEDLKNL